MALKTGAADTGDIIECSHDELTSTGMYRYAWFGDAKFSVLICLLIAYIRDVL